MLKITTLTSKHLNGVIAILQPILKDARLKHRLKMHIGQGIAKIGVDDVTGKIDAIGCFVVDDDKRCSLSYYWVHPKYRGKMESLFFYTHIFTLIPREYSVFIHAKNIESFKNYVEPTPIRNEYKWIGLRSIEKLKTKAQTWAELQKP